MNNQKGISLILIILIIVGVLVVGGGVWYYLVQTTITVLSPNGGEAWRIGSIQKISWQIFNQPAKSWVSLSLEKGDGKVFPILGGYTGNSTNYTVSQDLPEDLPIGNDYKIKACLYQNIIKCFTEPCPANRILACDSSDAAFSIAAAENQ